MTLDEIKGLIAAMAASDLADMEVARDGWTLRLRRSPAGAHAAVASSLGEVERPPAPPLPATGRAGSSTPRAAETANVRAPLGGIAYLSPSPDAAPFVTAGAAVTKGAILCTIEAMKTFNEVRAERDGTVEAVLFASGDEVEAGQLLLRLG